MKVSVVISAYNEESKIEDCLKSVKNIANEIIFVDNSSTDQTIEIAKKYTNKIYVRQNNPMLNVNKNFGFTKTGSEWILCLDADERITPELSKEILELDEKVSDDGFFIPRKNILFGKWIRHSIWWPDYQLRLFRKDKGKFPEVHVHEYVEVDGQTTNLQNPIEHLNYQSVSQYIYKLEKIYTENEVENILKKGEKLNWVDALRLPLHDFLKTYFLQKGYKDGLHGLVLSLLQAFYMIIVFAKVWEKQGFEEKQIDFSDLKKEFKSLGGEISYWIVSTELSESKSTVKKMALRLRRKTLKKSS